MSSKKAKYLGIIPARGGSRGIPHKNLVKVAGRPLIAYTFQEALASNKLDKVVLSTDDKKIAALGKKYSVEVPFQRPAKYANDKATLEAVMLHALDWLKEHEEYLPDAVVLLQPTSPLRTARHIDAAIGLFEQSKVDSLVSVSCPMEHPCDMATFNNMKMTMLFEGEGFLAGKQRQAYPDYYFINGAIYIFSTNILYKYKSRFGKTVLPYLMRQIESIDVDSRDDLEMADLILSKRAFIK